MKIESVSKSFLHFFKERSVPFIRENGKIIIRFVLTAFFIGIGAWFIKHEKTEFFLIGEVLSTANWIWIVIGISLVAVYIILQGLLYKASFSAVHSKVSLKDTIILFLKRNFISVFLPAGGISSLAFFTKTIEKKGIKETQIYFASSIYGFIGILSVILVAIPTFIYALSENALGSGEWYSFITLVLLIVTLYFVYKSIIEKGVLYKWLVKFFPASEVFIADFQSNKIAKNKFLLSVLFSFLIEIAGIAHLYVAMAALHFTPSLFTATMGYVVSVIFLIASPFLRGLGAIEVSMSYCLVRLGFGSVESIAITFLYRFFEFWTPLLAGIIAFLSKINKLLLRIFPALLLFCLGILNIVSVLTPAIADRLDRVTNFLPVEAIHASNYLVMMAGFLLLVTAAFMLKGLRIAWGFGLILSVLSLIGHLTKAIDFEEATVAFIIILALLATRKEYYIKSNPRLRLIGLQTSLFSIFIVLVYGIIGFYFIDKKHFNIDFSLLQSIRYTVQNYVLVGSSDLVPVDGFANHFLVSIRISGFLSFTFLVFTLIRPYVLKNEISANEKSSANELIKLYGNSPLDYFKTYFDKLIFFSKNKNSFISYRVAGSFAVVLENPVAPTKDEMKTCITEFDYYCYENGLKSIYYRISEDSLHIYLTLGKKNLFLGQTGIVDLSIFSLEGGNKKSLRNALNKIEHAGLKVVVLNPPIKDGMLQKLKSVSDEWLSENRRKEIIFSQGMFLWEELKRHTIIAVENSEEKIIAFLNVIPDYISEEGTYDLIRKTNDAPNGIMDFILVELFKYLKSQNYSTVNLGFAPMSGIDDPDSFPGKTMKYAYEKFKSFSHYKGLRDYKEKFATYWKSEYLIYSHDYDLLQIPSVLANVIKT